NNGNRPATAAPSLAALNTLPSHARFGGTRVWSKGTASMFRMILAAGASLAVLAVAAPALAQDAAAIPTPTMSFGTWGFDPATLDTAVDPGDDFFAYANGKWVRDNPL